MQADGRVLAEPVISMMDIPAWDTSQMDGYAVRAAELEADPDRVFPISQRIPAGHPGLALRKGTVARIFTGAALPVGADAVVMQENAEEVPLKDGSKGVRFRLRVQPQPGEMVCRKADNVQAGTEILPAGTALTPTDSLDPNTATSPGIMMTISYIYGSLAATTDKGTKMRLAESITPNATADEWTVKLRKGLTYSDGTPVTGQDVLASFQHLAQAPEYKTLYGGIDFAASKAEGSTAVLKLAAPSSDFLESTLAMMSPIAPKGQFTGVGAGPYALQKGDSSTGYQLKSNPKYWAGEPKIKRVEVKMIASASARAKALKAGEIDYAYGLDSASLATLKSASDLVTPKPTLQSASAMDLVLNTRVAPFNDPEVRRAAKLTLDRAKMVKTLLGESGELGNDMLGKGYPSYPKDIEQVKADKEKARKIFASKGVTSFTIMAADITPGLVASAELMAQEFKKVGVDVKIEKADAQSYFSQMDKLYASPAFTMYWINRPAMGEFRMQADARSPYNVSGYSSQAMTEKFTKATQTLDEKSRDKLVAEISQEIHESGGDLVWGFQKQLSAYRKGLKGLVVDQSMPWIAEATFSAS